MFWLKHCPRCAGDLYQEQDIDGSYIACLQCGYHSSATDETSPRMLPRQDMQSVKRGQTLQERRVRIRNLA
jgi:DNA-directed RNA polymerase subunit M/transcription elongation factor TFIIS